VDCGPWTLGEKVGFKTAYYQKYRFIFDEDDFNLIAKENPRTFLQNNLHGLIP
jgi:hypothetical protein